LEKGPSRSARQVALQQLRVLVEILEAQNVNWAFRSANWAWLTQWDQGVLKPKDVASRCQLVFPTICACARVQRSDGRKLSADASASLAYLSGWCSDFLEREDVKRYLERQDVRRSLSDFGADTSPGADSVSAAGLGNSSDDDEAFSGDDVDEAGEVLGFGRRRYEGQEHCWDVADATEMMVRGPSYLSDQRKVHSRSAMLELVDAHLFKANEEIVHYAKSSRGNILKMRQEGDDRFFFTMNFRLIPVQFAITWAVPKKADFLQKPEGLLFQRFREMSDDERNTRIKILLKVLEGPWIVKKGVPDRPGVVGRKTAIEYFADRDHIEASVNCISSQAGRRIASLLTGAARHFAMEIFIILEGQKGTELPERILASVGVHHGDLSKIPTC
jgi:hypothetical protein